MPIAIRTIAIFAIALAGCGSVSPSQTAGTQSSATLGQTRLEYEALPVNGQQPSATDLQTIKDIVAQRVVGLGAVDPVVTVEGDRVVIDVPDPDDLDAVRGLASATGRIDFVPLGSESIAEGVFVDRLVHPPLFSGDQVESATLDTDQNGRAAIDFVLREDGRARFAAHTAAHVGDYFAITLDNRVISALVINAVIGDGNVQITGSGIEGFALDEARRIDAILRLGSLPFPIREVAPATAP